MDNINKIYDYFMNDQRNIENSNIESDNPKLLWHLRKYNNISDFINKLEDIESHFFQNKIDNDLYLLNIIYKIIGSDNLNAEYKSNNIEKEILIKLNILNEIYEFIIFMYNNLNKDRYLFVRRVLKNIYDNIKTIIIKYNGF